MSNPNHTYTHANMHPLPLSNTWCLVPCSCQLRQTAPSKLLCHLRKPIWNNPLIVNNRLSKYRAFAHNPQQSLKYCFLQTPSISYYNTNTSGWTEALWTGGPTKVLEVPLSTCGFVQSGRWMAGSIWNWDSLTQTTALTQKQHWQHTLITSGWIYQNNNCHILHKYLGPAY